MADSKVSELTSATSVGGGDVFYVVQSNTSKKVTAATLFSNAENPSLKGNIVIGGTAQELASPGIISITTPITHLSIDAVGGALQIPAGSAGQVKILTTTSVSGGTMTLGANIAGSGTITFNNVGDTATLLYTNSKWHVIGGTANVTY